MGDSFVHPGYMLGFTTYYTPGDNVYVKDSHIYSAVLGNVTFTKNEANNKEIISVKSNHVKIPYVGSTVIAQVTNLYRKQADCNIICVDGRVLKDTFKGVLMSNNLHESKSIDVILYDWIKPGDIIRAKVIYAGSGKQMVLSTAQPNLGVIKTQSLNGEDMFPISWKYFMSTRSGIIEKRKVAKEDKTTN